MKLLATAGFISICTVMGFGQNNQSRNSSPDKITLLAENETKDGGILKLRGHVEVITGSMTVYADEADYNALTGDLDAHGHVHINFGKVTPAMKVQNASPEDLPATIPVLRNKRVVRRRDENRSHIARLTSPNFSLVPRSAVACRELPHSSKDFADSTTANHLLRSSVRH